MGLWESVAIVVVFSIGVIVADEIIDARRPGGAAAAPGPRSTRASLTAASPRSCARARELRRAGWRAAPGPRHRLTPLPAPHTLGRDARARTTAHRRLRPGGPPPHHRNPQTDANEDHRGVPTSTNE